MLLEAYASWCGHCQQLAPEYKKLPKMLEGEVKVAAVDADNERDVAQRLGVQGFPDIRLFGPDKDRPKQYSGDRDAESIAKWARTNSGSASALGKLATQITSDNAHTTVHSSSLPKAVAFAQSDKLLPEWLPSLAVKYKRGKEVDVAFAYSGFAQDPGLAETFGLSKNDLPALALLLPDGTGEGTYAILTRNELSAGSKAKNLKAAKEFIDATKSGTLTDDRIHSIPHLPRRPPSSSSSGSGSSSKAAAVQLTKDNEASACFSNENKLCILAFLDGSDGSDAMDSCAKRFAKEDVKFAWVDGHKQRSLMSDFGLSSGGLPTAVGIKPGRRRFTAMKSGDFSSDSLTDFVSTILGGDARFTSFDGSLSVSSDGGDEL